MWYNRKVLFSPRNLTQFDQKLPNFDGFFVVFLSPKSQKFLGTFQLTYVDLLNSKNDSNTDIISLMNSFPTNSTSHSGNFHLLNFDCPHLCFMSWTYQGIRCYSHWKCGASIFAHLLAKTILVCVYVFYLLMILNPGPDCKQTLLRSLFKVKTNKTNKKWLHNNKKVNFCCYPSVASWWIVKNYLYQTYESMRNRVHELMKSRFAH